MEYDMKVRTSESRRSAPAKISDSELKLTVGPHQRIPVGPHQRISERKIMDWLVIDLLYGILSPYLFTIILGRGT